MSSVATSITSKLVPRALTPERLVVIALLCATAIKMAWALTSAGSVDVVLFFNFARALEKVGLNALYSLEPKFNHTPLTSGFVVLLYRSAGGDFLTFAFFLRLASILSDLAVVAGLLRWRQKLAGQPPWWALVAFAISPVSIMVSGFHGNVDPIMTAALFFAALAAVHDRPLLCGLLFGLACNVKIVPIVFAPVFFFFWLHRGRPWRFAVTTGAILLAGSALPLLNNPLAYLHNVFGYGSTWGVWGIPYLLRLSGWSEVQTIGFNGLSAVQTNVATVLKLAIVAGIIMLGWRRRKVDLAEFPATLGVAWLVFFVGAPGVGVQYMVWFAPFLLLLAPRGWLVATVAATAFLFSFYQSCSGGRWPWFLAMPLGPETATWCPWALAVWLVCVGLLLSLRGKKRAITLAPALQMPSEDLASAEPAIKLAAS